MNLKEQCIAFCIPVHKKKRVMKRRLARMFYHKFKCYKDYRDWHGRILYEVYIKNEEESYKQHEKDLQEALMEDSDAYLFAD